MGIGDWGLGIGDWGLGALIKSYRATIPAEKRATTCVDCGQCLPKCPQQIRIPNQMSRIVEMTRRRRR